MNHIDFTNIEKVSFSPALFLHEGIDIMFMNIVYLYFLVHIEYMWFMHISRARNYSIWTATLPVLCWLGSPINIFPEKQKKWNNSKTTGVQIFLIVVHFSTFWVHFFCICRFAIRHLVGLRCPRPPQRKSEIGRKLWGYKFYYLWYI